MGIQKCRWGWDSKLVNDRESVSFGLVETRGKWRESVFTGIRVGEGGEIRERCGRKGKRGTIKCSKAHS